MDLTPNTSGPCTNTVGLELSALRERVRGVYYFGFSGLSCRVYVGGGGGLFGILGLESSGIYGGEVCGILGFQLSGAGGDCGGWRGQEEEPGLTYKFNNLKGGVDSLLRSEHQHVKAQSKEGWGTKPYCRDNKC